MKKVFALLIAILIFALSCSSIAFADGYSYEINSFCVESESISFEVKNISDEDASATVYIVLYDEYNMILNMKSVPVNVTVGSVETISEPFMTNEAVTAKVFAWKGALSPCSKTVYKTSVNNGDIEFGGDI